MDRGEEGAVLQHSVPHHLHVPDEVQQIPVRQVTLCSNVPLSFVAYCPYLYCVFSIGLTWDIKASLQCNYFSHICSFWIGSTNFDETKMTFGLDRLTYDIGQQNPVLDYIIEVVELPEKLVNLIHDYHYDYRY